MRSRTTTAMLSPFTAGAKACRERVRRFCLLLGSAVNREESLCPECSAAE
jgi:hypothetical protein